jgi:hypothetical protein
MKLDTNYPWMKGNQVCPNKGPEVLFKGEIITKMSKWSGVIEKSSSPEPLCQF